MAKKLKPALYEVPGSTWAWVSLKELAEILRLSPYKVWSRFFGFARDGRMMIADASTNEVWTTFVHGCCVDDVWCVMQPLPHDIYAFESADIFIERLLDGDFLVPAGWSERVLREVRERNVGSISLNVWHNAFLNTLLARYAE